MSLLIKLIIAGVVIGVIVLGFFIWLKVRKDMTNDAATSTKDTEDIDVDEAKEFSSLEESVILLINNLIPLVDDTQDFVRLQQIFKRIQKHQINEEELYLTHQELLQLYNRKKEQLRRGALSPKERDEEDIKEQILQQKREYREELKTRKESATKFDKADMEAIKDNFVKLKAKKHYHIYNVEEEVDSVSGIYVIFVKVNPEIIVDLVPIYIGQSINMRKRLQDHRNQIFGAKEKLDNNIDIKIFYEKLQFYLDNHNLSTDDVFFTFKKVDEKELNNFERETIANFNANVCGLNSSKGKF